jgi:hypothetical protein
VFHKLIGLISRTVKVSNEVTLAFINKSREIAQVSRKYTFDSLGFLKNEKNSLKELKRSVLLPYIIDKWHLVKVIKNSLGLQGFLKVNLSVSFWLEVTQG